MDETMRFIEVRDMPLRSKRDWNTPYRTFAWPRFETFNWS
jgi:hypothetical protein